MRPIKTPDNSVDKIIDNLAINGSTDINIERREQDDTFSIVIDLFEYNPEDVKIELNNNSLILNAVKESESQSDKVFKQTSKYIKKSITLPKSIDKKDYNTTFINGILEIEFNKYD